MSRYFNENRPDVTTAYTRPSTKPFRTHKVPETYDGKLVPPTISFRLPDGTTLKANTEQEIVIGRKSRPEDPEVTIDLAMCNGQQHGVSRIHAMIAVLGKRLTLQDLDSVNGTLLNGERITPLNRYPIVNGDKITLGSLTMQVFFIGAPTRTR